MADVKISGLPASTVPLAGTEVLPIVQGGTTKQVSIANVTAGRDVSALSITTPTYKAANSAGGALQNASGVNQLQWGAGGGNNLSVDVAITINPANAAVAISPTGTGTVAISPAGALTINPTAASTMNNVAIGATTASTGAFSTLSATGVTTVQAGSVSAPAITTTGDTNTGIFFPAADTIAFTEGGVESVRIDSSGNVSLATGNLVMSTSGKGIDFSATSGTGTSELLDDYEEGTWTPAYQATGGGAATHAIQIGTYTKVGNQVTLFFQIRGDKNTLSGGISISGVPFAPANVGAGVAFAYVDDFATDMVLRGFVESSQITLYKGATNALTMVNITDADMITGSTARNQIYGSVTYITT